jgi:DNA-binding NtrC family response regulator
MDRLKLLLVDLFPQDDVLIEVRAVLGSASNLSWEIKHETLASEAIGSAARRLSSVKSRFQPDINLLSIGPNSSDLAEHILEILRCASGGVGTLVLSSQRAYEPMAALLARGASDYVIPPLRAIDLLPRIRRLVRWPSQAESSAEAIKDELGLSGFIGQSAALMEELKNVSAAARCPANVLITGETGTGKELVAKAIHDLSSRASKPFVPVDCGAIPPELIENELFGHEAEAFTSARTTKAGLIQAAAHGTLFLDEVHALSLCAQAKFLRFVQEKQYRSVGSDKICNADIRIVAATNIDLRKAAADGRFREDLFYRLHVIPISLPPLRARMEDIPRLTEHFLGLFALAYERPVPEITPAALQKLLAYDWPGNIRQLRNVIESAVVLAKNRTVDEQDIQLPGATVAQFESFQARKARAIAEFERAELTRLLVAHGGNISQAARAAGKHPRAFWGLTRKYRLKAVTGLSQRNSDAETIVALQ